MFELDALLAEYHQLLEERGTLLEAHAPLWARYGIGGTAPMLRNHKESRIKRSLRDEHPGWTETRLQEELSATEEYLSTVKSIEDRRQDYARQKDALELNARRLALLATRIRLAGATLDDSTTFPANSDGLESSA
jgi:hypothetical protein